MIVDPDLTNFLEEYERRTNTHQFEEVASLIAEDAVFWFTDGSFRGLEAIQNAFQRTWAVIRDEQYQIVDVEWLSVEPNSAACIYTFRWQGIIDGAIHQGSGRGTSLLRKKGETWQVAHEHLSRFPD
jgi:ketosteroid isomerase-like protein